VPGDWSATVGVAGAATSLINERVDWVATIPDESVMSAVAMTVASETAVTFRVVLKVFPPLQVGVPVTEPKVTVTVRPLSEQVPEMVKAALVALFT